MDSPADRTIDQKPVGEMPHDHNLKRNRTSPEKLILDTPLSIVSFLGDDDVSNALYTHFLIGVSRKLERADGFSFVCCRSYPVVRTIWYVSVRKNPTRVRPCIDRLPHRCVMDCYFSSQLWRIPVRFVFLCSRRVVGNGDVFAATLYVYIICIIALIGFSSDLSDF